MCHIPQINAIMIKKAGYVHFILTAFGELESNRLRFCSYKRLDAGLQICIREKHVFREASHLFQRCFGWFLLQ